MKREISADFIRGFARTLDLSGTKEWPKITDSMSRDYEALRSDWEDVGKAIRREFQSCPRV
ncbi:MAG: hypothetical protein NC420_12395 [Eubacterium sp.]|nr:hypothetical protein [Eubacterium sp.]MCM1215756.1 hypothetical protein [Lachnospiraceae bacterium]MCM1305529.1 hypothetical protein [Butyrivibrio sp.]MCM1344784.1 hypothetical protein [Muribaculaceae bacterium]MCM1238320.1 hypothetical protein [Lachnospiraceae bacterium]